MKHTQAVNVVRFAPKGEWPEDRKNGEEDGR